MGLLIVIVSLTLVCCYFLINNETQEEPTSLDDIIVKKIKSHNTEWIESLDIIDNKDIYFDGYYGPIGQTRDVYELKPIEINIGCTPEEMINVVDKDTKFIKENPSYFKKGQQRKIYYDRSWPLPKGEYKGYKNYIDNRGKHLDLDFTRDETMRVWFTNEINEIGRDKVCDDVEVVEVFGLKKTDHYQFLLDEDRIKIKNLKYIILYEEEKVEPINIYKHTLQKLYPNATIHLVEPNKEQ